MSGGPFSPSPPLSPDPAPAVGRQVVHVDRTLQYLRGRFFDPVVGDFVPLPPHRWELQNKKRLQGDMTDAVVEGTWSDKEGVSEIKEGPAFSVKEAAKETWYFVLHPKVSDGDLSKFQTAGEIWIDLKEKKWVIPEEFPRIEKRRVVRMPFWMSHWKAKSGKHADPGPSKTFVDDGFVTTAELRKTHTSAKSPWDLLLDYGWLRTYVQFRYYDVKQKKRTPVPPGLLVEALGKKLRYKNLTFGHVTERVGAGASIDDKGTIYVLHERVQADSGDVELKVKTHAGVRAYIDLAATPSTGEADQRVKTAPAGKVPESPLARYLLPETWHSNGWEVLEGGARKAWTDVRTKLVAKDAPLIFDLDDTVLVDHATGPATLPADARITLFDHSLAFRGPAFDPVVRHWWSEKLKKNLLRAEEAIASDGDTFKKTTFVVNHEGTFYVRRDRRVEGEPGVTPLIGARSAVSRAPEDPIALSPHDTDPSMLLLLKDAYPGPYSASEEGPFLAAHPDAKLCHLLVYVSLDVTANPGNAGAAPPVPAATNAERDAIYPLLLEASKRWDQLHPAHAPFSRARKDYVVIPSKGVKAGTRVIKLRHFFGKRTDGKHDLTIEVSHDGVRSYAGPLPGSSDKKKRRLVAIVSSINLNGPGTDAADDDKVSEQVFTLAHEIGHVMWLDDEYMEVIDVRSVAGAINGGPAVPCFTQRFDGFPFWADDTSMMRFSELPRLRYHNHRLPPLNAAMGASGDDQYLLSHPSYKGGLMYKPPPVAHVWKVAGSSPLSGARATAVLFRVGDDEATVDKLFPRPAGTPSAPGNWIEGIVVVRTLIWFAYLASTVGNFASDLDRWQILRDFYSKHVWPPDYKPPKRFMLSGPSAPVRKLGIILEPRFEFGPAPSAGVTPSAANVVVEIVFQAAGAPVALPLPSSLGIPSKLVVNHGQQGTAILRYALGHAFNAAAPDNSPLGAADLGPVARAVETIVAAAPGAYSVVEL